MQIEFCIIVVIKNKVLHKERSVKRFLNRFFLFMLASNIIIYAAYDETALYYNRNRKYVPGSTEEIVSFDVQKEEDSDEVIHRRGMLMIHEDAPATVIIAHGFMANSFDALTFRPALFAGYNTFAFDFRAHGECSQGQICTLGKNEAFDVIGAVKFIKSHPKLKDKPIILYGFSMGAMSILQAHAHESVLFSPQAKNAPVVAGIYDCPSKSSDDIIQNGLDTISFSFFGYKFGVPCKEFIKKCAYHWAIQPLVKYLFKCLASMDSTQICTELQPFYPVESAKEVKTPSLFIICKNDGKVSIDNVKDIYTNTQGFKRLWVTNGRRHFDSYFYNPEKYIYKVRKFMANVLDDRLHERPQEKILTDPKLLHHKLQGAHI